MSTPDGALDRSPRAAAADTLAGAVREALRESMRADPRVVVLGEDVGRLGGLFGVTEGLAEEFGERRVIEMPAAEGGIVGTALGMAMYGLRPVAEVQLADFAWPALDQLLSEVSMLRYRSGGRYEASLVLRVPYGGGLRGGLYQSQSMEGLLTRIPGLVVVAPATPADAAGLMRSAIRSADPVIVLEPKRLYGVHVQQRPGSELEVPIGSARTARDGTDVTVITYGACVPVALEAAERAARSGIQSEVLDLRTLLPFDIGALLDSIAKTGRAVVVSEEPRTGSYAAEISATLAERALLHLEAPVMRICGFDTPVPLAFENQYLPDAGRVYAAIERVANL